MTANKATPEELDRPMPTLEKRLDELARITQVHVLYSEQRSQRVNQMPTKLPPAKSVGEETLALHLRAEGIWFTREFKFHPKRKWRSDFIIYGAKRPLENRTCFLVEIDGGNRMVVKGKAVGRHMKDEDYDKMNEMVILGWRVLRFTPAQVRSGKAIDTIKRALA